MFRWAGRLFIVLLLIAAIVSTGLWILPEANGTSRSLAIADEHPRKNLYVDWGPHFWNLRPFPSGRFIVPHHFVLLAEWHLWEGGTDSLSMSYRPTVEKWSPETHYWQSGNFRAYSDYMTLDSQALTVRNFTVDLPIWFLVAALWLCALLAVVPGPFRRWHRRRRGQCVRCAYDLTGLSDARCPECGLEFRPPPTPPGRKP